MQTLSLATEFTIKPSQFNSNFPLLSYLTKREKECLFHYLNGKTAKETAQVLNLSFRTIEEHLANIKMKLGCRYKRDLHSLFPRTFLDIA